MVAVVIISWYEYVVIDCFYFMILSKHNFVQWQTCLFICHVMYCVKNGWTYHLIFCMIAIAFLMKGEGVFLTRTLNAGGVWKKCIIICKNISKHYDDAWHSFLVLLMISWACCKSHFTGNTVLYCVEIIYLFRHGILCSSYRCGWRWQAGYCIQCCKIA